MCVFVCVGGGLLTIFFIPQAPMKRVWNLFLPQIDIKEHCKSLCKRQIIFENSPESTLDLTVGQNEYNYFFGYMLIHPSLDVVVSLACYSYSKSVRLGGFKSVENDYLNVDVTPQIFLNFQNYNTSATKYIFSLLIFLYIKIHMVHEREKCTPLLSYISRAVNVGAELIVYGNVS